MSSIVEINWLSVMCVSSSLKIKERWQRSGSGQGPFKPKGG
jgi:hypothetical protein